MKIWISENGKKAGPFEEYQLRAMVEDGDVDENTPAWHQNCEDGWITLKEIPSLTGLFSKEQEQETPEEFIERLKEEVNSAEEAEAQAQTKSDSDTDANERSPYSVPQTNPDQQLYEKQPYYPVRRFFARSFDIYLYMIGLYLFKVSQGMHPFQIDPDQPNRELLFYLPYVFIDCLLLHIFGTTPGKWLLNVNVSPFFGGRMPLGGTLMRSLRVWVLGFGMFIIGIISLPISWFFAHKLGMFLWDYPNRFRVTVKPLQPAKIVAYVLLFILASYLIQTFIPEHYIDDLKLRLTPED